MHLVALTGFLGSGKTTALLNFARETAASGAKSAVIVNEVGDVGIDNLVLKQLGADVWELLGGCICCTLTADLAVTLTKIKEEFNVDYVFLEPSGISNPDTIMSGLKYSSALNDLRISWLAIIDPLRLEELVEVFEPLMQSHIKRASVAVITKKSLATPEQLAYARQWIADQRPDLPVFVADMKSETERIPLEELLACLKN